jgi:hypothetical protein
VRTDLNRCYGHGLYPASTIGGCPGCASRAAGEARALLGPAPVTFTDAQLEQEIQRYKRWADLKIPNEPLLIFYPRRGDI